MKLAEVNIVFIADVRDVARTDTMPKATDSDITAWRWFGAVPIGTRIKS
jgi:hypothetical protein